MADPPLGLLSVLVYGVLVVTSPLVATAAWGLSQRRRSFRAALGTVAAVALGLVAASVAALALLVDATTGVVFGVLTVAAALVLAGFPLLIGRQLLDRWTPLGPDSALEYATLGWPVAMVASAVVFLAPAGFGDANVFSLSGSTAALAWLAMAAVVSLVPGVAGLAYYRLVEQFA